MDNELLTCNEVLSYLKLSRNALNKLIRSGNIPARKLGGKWHFARIDIERWMSAPRHDVSSEPSAAAAGENLPPGNADVISDLLKEERAFKPLSEFVSQANFSDPSIYEIAQAEGPRFWERFASELHWFKRWDSTMQWNPPYGKWFVGGQTNISYNCVDRNIERELRNKAAALFLRKDFAINTRQSFQGVYILPGNSVT